MLQGKETQSSVSTCISPGCSHETERMAVQAMTWTAVWFATWHTWKTLWTRQCARQHSSSVVSSFALHSQTWGWRGTIFPFQILFSIASSNNIPFNKEYNYDLHTLETELKPSCIREYRYTSWEKLKWLRNYYEISMSSA